MRRGIIVFDDGSNQLLGEEASLTNLIQVLRVIIPQLEQLEQKSLRDKLLAMPRDELEKLLAEKDTTEPRT